MSMGRFIADNLLHYSLNCNNIRNGLMFIVHLSDEILFTMTIQSQEPKVRFEI